MQGEGSALTGIPSVPHLDDSGRPTLRSVAALAGVSVSTVSRVLSTGGDPTRWASAKTVERIEQIAVEVGFTKNPHAAGLRTSRSNLAGVLVPRLTDMVLAIIYEGIGDSARKLGYQTFVTNSYDEAALRKDAADMLLARRVDGVIIGDALIDNDELLTSLDQRGVPFVLVSRRSADYPSVTCDDVVGGALAAKHLLEQGHTDIAIIAGEAYTSTSVDRSAGCRVVYAEADHPIPDARVRHCAFDVAGGRAAAAAILAEEPSVTAIFAVNDFAAIGALGAIRAAHRRVGTDIAVVGYNDTPLAGELPIPLTTVRSSMWEMGAQAMSLLHRRINGDPVESMRLKPTLSIRESSTTSLEVAQRAGRAGGLSTARNSCSGRPVVP